MGYEGIASKDIWAPVASMVAMVALAAPAGATEDRIANRESSERRTSAVPITELVDAGWIDIDMGEVGKTTEPFEVITSDRLVLSYTDAACVGDRMQVLDSGVAISNGSPLTVAPSCGSVRNGWRAILDRRFSSGVTTLRPGSHRLSFRTLSTFTGGFAAAFRIDTCTVTDPASRVFLGSSNDDVICGGANAETIVGGGGRDIVAGGGGADVIITRQGEGLVSGGSGADRLVGGPSADRLFGGPGGDKLRAEGGDDGLNGQGGIDVLLAGRGHDSLDGGPGPDVLAGGEGNDTCFPRRAAGMLLGCERGPDER
nr:calcium-binding protein [uncultured Nocardioides sp.]